MTNALQEARFDPEIGEAVLVAEDYCSPPLAMERDKVLDQHFDSLTIVNEEVGDNWLESINDLSQLRKQVLPGGKD